MFDNADTLHRAICCSTWGVAFRWPTCSVLAGYGVRAPQWPACRVLTIVLGAGSVGGAGGRPARAFARWTELLPRWCDNGFLAWRRGGQGEGTVHALTLCCRDHPSQCQAEAHIGCAPASLHHPSQMLGWRALIRLLTALWLVQATVESAVRSTLAAPRPLVDAGPPLAAPTRAQVYEDMGAETGASQGRGLCPCGCADPALR